MVSYCLDTVEDDVESSYFAVRESSATASATLGILACSTDAIRKIISWSPDVAALPYLASDHAWQQAIAATTPEQLTRLELMFMEDEERDGTEPLDFAGR